MPQIYATKDSAVTARETEHLALSRSLAGECAVLLENDGVLPLPASGRIALLGSGARKTVRGGTGSGDVNTREDISIEEGLERAGFTIATRRWLDRQDRIHEEALRNYRDWVAAKARESGMAEFFVGFSYPFQVAAPGSLTDEDLDCGTDTAVYIISRTSGEGADRYNKRGDYLLYEEEKAQLETLGKRFGKLVVVLNVGGVMDLSELRAIPGIRAVLLMGQLGSLGGEVLADLLLGKTVPSGKLTDTWAKTYSDYPAAGTFSHNDGNVDDEYYTEGIYVGYRYFDTFGVEPLYPFGYGRSYTTFRLTPCAVRAEEGQVAVSVTVTNTGSACSGREVVQAYVSAPGANKPYQELAGYAKTGLLAPGQSETVTIRFAAADMASYHAERAAWVLDAGEYILRTGSSSRDTRPAAVLVLEEAVCTEKVKNLFPDRDPVRDITPPVRAREAVDASVPRVGLAGIPTRTVEYQTERRPMATDKTDRLTLDDIRAGRCTVEELVAQLTVEEMAELCVGTAREGGSVLGSASRLVPGAAGDTCPLASRGIRNLVLADGPAGLRLQPVFRTGKDGGLVPLDSPDAAETYYQYCTALPIGWCLAQSWDTALLERAGDMVGREMELFGVDLWLAPALNIHRDPLCGRNFEYFSEDPLVSGRTAAAITNGVQRHPGKGTTIKHFAANSQEDNRYFTNAHISERAMREIYLKGFEIAVRESQPMSIMTSYNLVNGIHTANDHDLIQSAARDEWGFRGVVMTDWCTSQAQSRLMGPGSGVYPISASTGCIYAGNDLQMPGCRENVDDIVKAVTSGQPLDGFTITLADLQFNTANVIRAVLAADAV